MGRGSSTTEGKSEGYKFAPDEKASHSNVKRPRDEACRVLLTSEKSFAKSS